MITQDRLPSACRSALAALLALGAPEAAQSSGSPCPVPDDLDGGPCCAPASPFVPAFPRFEQDALEICWRDCDADAVLPCRALWNDVHVLPAAGMPCGERRIRLDLSNATGAVKWTGNLRLQYSRTWLATDPGGLELQVWRFLVNGDMRPVAPLASPCPLPSCAPAHGDRVRFTGHVDYAASCSGAATTYQHAWMLTHACDALDHQPGFPRGGTFHPERAYTFVGPAAGFVPGALQPTEGTPSSSHDSLRRRELSLAPARCQTEEGLSLGLFPVQQLCLCGSGPGTLQQHTVANLTIGGACGTSVTTPVEPNLTGFVSMGIGSWTNAGSFPGVGALRWNTGTYDYQDACTPGARREAFFGVSTIGGYPARQLTAAGPGAPLPSAFVDQSNSLAPRGLRATRNVPYVSDHFLALNP